MPAPRQDPGPSPAGPAEPVGPAVIGVLGGVGAGKSAVARLLAGSDGEVVSADELAHEVLASDELARLIGEHFGPRALDERGRPDREALAALAFDPEAGPEVRRKLEGWTHPRVRARIWERLREARTAGTSPVVLDVPLLLENDAQHGLARRCDVLVFVDADPAVREERVRRSRGWSPGEVARREAAQLPVSEKRERADHVVANNGTLVDLEAAVRRILERL